MNDRVTTFSFDPKTSLPRKGFKGLFHLLNGFQVIYILSITFLTFAMTAKTSTYMLLRFFIDKVLGEKRDPYWYPLVAGGFILLALFQGLCTFLSGKLAAKTSEGIIQRLRNYLYNHLQNLSFSYHDRANTGELIQRTTGDVDTLRRFYSEQAISLGRVLLLFIINFAAIINLNLKLALVSVAVVPVIVLVSVLFFRAISKKYQAFQQQEAKLTTTLQESLTGIRVVKAFARKWFEIEKFDRDNSEKFRRGKRLVYLHSAFWPMTDILCGFQMLAGYLTGAIMTINGTITIGSYLAYSGLLIWIIFPMRMLGRLIVESSKAKVSYGRILDIIEQEPESIFKGKKKSTEKINGEIVFKDVSFQYDEKIPVLNNINLSVKPGEVVALLGHTGSGKTTLVNLLPRFYSYTKGSILLDGEELNTYSKEFLRRIIGIVEQEPFLFSLTIAENMAYGVRGKEITKREIEEAAKAAAIHDSIVSFPNGYDTLVGEKGVTLSGGQKQRIAIARALLKNPKVLILDDSTSSVDTETEQQIWGALEKLMHGRTTFIIAHRIQSLMKADIICVLEKGKIIEMGTHKELIQRKGIYKKIYELQSSIDEKVETELKNA
ncbi:MAG: ABC transporter ATP-binding protein [Spirochaetales bacterium]|nr:ABC transporter ATP-binding protein [Spirochaetales bacterium]